MHSMEEIISLVVKFRDERDWKQFHNAKDLALALSIEAGELNELFLWKKAEDADPERIKEELADILMYAIFLADKQGIDIAEIIGKKLEVNAEKYPIDKARGNAKKYDQL
ncbi:MAG: nucleotide pyrophosphohydrolase [Chitinophagaceae bacterium]